MNKLQVILAATLVTILVGYTDAEASTKSDDIGAPSESKEKT
jgi:hypothetical protein